MQQEVAKMAIQSGIFAVLFVSLLFWVLRTNDSREKRYQATIDKLADRFSVLEDVERGVCHIEEELKEMRRCG